MKEKKNVVAAVMIGVAEGGRHLLTGVNSLTILFGFPLNQPTVLLLKQEIIFASSHLLLDELPRRYHSPFLFSEDFPSADH